MSQSHSVCVCLWCLCVCCWVGLLPSVLPSIPKFPNGAAPCPDIHFVCRTLLSCLSLENIELFVISHVEIPRSWRQV
jgi:hypothetical protein